LNCVEIKERWLFAGKKKYKKKGEMGEREIWFDHHVIN
jgi:hypothetical protein